MPFDQIRFTHPRGHAANRFALRTYRLAAVPPSARLCVSLPMIAAKFGHDLKCAAGLALLPCPQIFPDIVRQSRVVDISYRTGSQNPAFMDEDEGVGAIAPFLRVMGNGEDRARP